MKITTATTIQNLINQVDRKNLTNAQKALIRLLKAEGDWVARTQIQVPSAGARLRDLRKEQYGSFDVRCSSAQKLDRPRISRGQNSNIITYYRINLRTATVNKVKEILGIK